MDSCSCIVLFCRERFRELGRFDQSFQAGRNNPKTVHIEIAEPATENGIGTVVYLIIASSRVEELRSAYDGVFVSAQATSCFVRDAVRKDVVVHFQSPTIDLNGLIGRHYDITGKHVAVPSRADSHWRLDISQEYIRPFANFDARGNGQLGLGLQFVSGVAQFTCSNMNSQYQHMQIDGWQTDKFYHILVVYQGSKRESNENTMTLYVDGQKIDETGTLGEWTTVVWDKIRGIGIGGNFA